jgi:hypothetical protein
MDDGKTLVCFYGKAMHSYIYGKDYWNLLSLSEEIAYRQLL